MMNTLVNMTLSASAVLLLWLAAARALKDRLPACWHYRILKFCLFFFLAPVGHLGPAAARLLNALRPGPAVTASVVIPGTPAIPAAAAPPIPSYMPLPTPLPEPQASAFSLTAGGLRVLAVIWAAGAAAVLLYKSYVYLQLRRRIFRQNQAVSQPAAQVVFWACKRQLGIRGPVALRENPVVRSPLASGLFRPMVVIPAAPMAVEELRYMLLHELTHIKSGDLWVRVASVAALAVHWFNPLAHLLRRSIRTVSEQSCDERVVCAMSQRERYAYGKVIVKLAVSIPTGTGDWAASLSTRESIERRLTRVLQTKQLKGFKRLLALALAIAILACGASAALAAQEPLPISKESGEPARMAPTLPAENYDERVENTIKPAEIVPAVAAQELLPASGEDGESARVAPTLPAGDEDMRIGDTIKPVGTIPAEAAAPKESSAAQPEANRTDNPVTTNGTPSEAFLKELREYFSARVPGITEDTPVLFGDHALIVSRGGTLLPDNDLSSYTCIDSVICKSFLDKNGGLRDEYLVGNKDFVDFPNQLKELTADGDYPKNSKGESYGSDTLACYVGYRPDLSYRAEYPYERRPAGYIRESELHVPDHTAQECKKEYAIPLYNPEGEVIDKYLLGCGSSHINTTGMSVEDVKAAIAAKATTTEEARVAAAEAAQNRVLQREKPANPYTVYYDANGNWHQQEEVRGDLDLIRSRGGTLLPDGDGISYLSYTSDNQHVYRRYRDRDGVLRREDLVGSRDLLPEEARALLNTLVNGEYPKNAKGESYGYECLADYVGYAPDLAVWVDGPEQGYWRQKEMEDKADALHFACKCPGEFQVPLYSSDGKTVKTHVTYICLYSVHPA